MTKVKIVVTGSEVINERLAKLTNKEAKDAIRKASRTALRPLLERCKSTCPVKSGKMRQSIKLRAMKRSRKSVGSTVTVANKEKAYTGKEFYASFIIFGRKTGRRVRNKDLGIQRFQRRNAAMKEAAEKIDAERRQIPPNKFMQDAVDALEDHVRTTYYREIGLIIHNRASGK